ncbi:recombinase family protein [Pseudoflavitalea rhizosphaerae]|uniref:recombinase family protein n=1 Tax=Pseudoflavitalea rhizosphaerae TaxID=1884793 RepID=UPI000F8F527C|nr:recombinase family protein [Pseudoflavitalea rhizosphaerae]
METADLYIRVSTEEQAQTGYSQRYQEEVLRTYCEIHGIIIRKTFFEDYSAKTFNRPQWNKLIAEYKIKKPKGLSLLLVTKWDRFSRNTGDAYYMINYLLKLGIEAKAIEQPLDLTIPENKIMMAFFLSIPEVENARRSLNVKEGIERAKKEGRWIGSAPVGYRNKISESGQKYIQAVEPQAGIMKQAFQKIAYGIYSIKEIYDEAFDNGLQRSYNCFWKALRNPAYCGLIKLKTSQSADALFAVGQHDPLISESLFQEVQKVLAKKRKHYSYTHTNVIFPFRGLLICPKCGKSLTGSSSQGRGKKYDYYHCISKCGVRIPVSKVHMLIQKFTSSFDLLPDFKPLFSYVLEASMKATIDQNSLNHQRLLKKIEDLTFRIDKARELLLGGSLNPKEYKTIRSNCENQINILGEALQNGTRENKFLALAISTSEEKISNLNDLIENYSTNKKKEIFKYLFPYGITCNVNRIDENDLSVPLRCIYIKQEIPTNLSTTLSEIEEKLLEEPPKIKEEVKTLVNKLKICSVRQCKDIVAYFRKLSEIILDQAIERKLISFLT